MRENKQREPTPLVAKPLCRQLFSPFGDVVETGAAREQFPINHGTSTRFDSVADVDVLGAGGRILVSIFRGQPATLPARLNLMERHPLGTQAFVPMQRAPFLVVVALPGPAPTIGDLHAFVTNGSQGVNYHRGVWHHPLLAMGEVSDFLVIDRGGPGHNCDQVIISEPGVHLILESHGT